MSYLRTTALTWTAEVPVQTGDGITAWAQGTYYELIPATPDRIQILDFAIVIDAVSQPLDGQITIAIGPAGHEIPLGHRRWKFSGSAGDGLLNLPFRVPLFVGSGMRVSVAAQSNISAKVQLYLALGYTVADPSTQVTTLRYAAIPDSATSIAVTPNAVAWTYSDWVELTTGLAWDAYLTGVVYRPAAITVPYQIQVGTGAGPDQIVGTFKGNSGNLNASGQANTWNQGHSFPRPCPVEAGTPIWVRFAKSDTDTTDWRFSLEYLTAEFLAPAPVGSLTVTKVISDPASDVTTEFSYQVFGGLLPATFTLVNGASQNYATVPVGVYSVLETLPNGSWEQVSVVVSNGDDPSAITIADGEGVTVTFTNRQRPIVPETENVVDRRLRRAPHLNFEQLWRFYNYIQFDVESGVGLTTGQGESPVLQVRWSDDGGHTWSNIRQVPLGKKGEYRKRAITRLLGRSRDRVFEVVVSDPVKAVLLAAYINYEQGVH